MAIFCEYGKYPGSKVIKMQTNGKYKVKMQKVVASQRLLNVVKHNFAFAVSW